MAVSYSYNKFSEVNDWQSKGYVINFSDEFFYFIPYKSFDNDEHKLQWQTDFLQMIEQYHIDKNSNIYKERKTNRNS